MNMASNFHTIKKHRIQVTVLEIHTDSKVIIFSIFFSFKKLWFEVVIMRKLAANHIGLFFCFRLIKKDTYFNYLVYTQNYYKNFDTPNTTHESFITLYITFTRPSSYLNIL